MTSKSLTVVVVNWNTKDLLRDCLRSVFEAEGSESYEVIVVDNASQDGSAEMVGAEFPQARLVREESNVGFAVANNDAIRLSDAEFILLLNSDTLVPEKSLADMVGYMKEHPAVGVLGCKILNPDGSPQDSSGHFPSMTAVTFTKLNRALGGRLSFLPVSHRPVTKEAAVDWVTGACLMARKTAIDKAGLLDENIFMYFEDIDWSYRIKRAGWEVRVITTAAITHFGGQSAKKSDGSLLYEYRRAQFILFKKHKGFCSRSALRIVIMASALVGLARQSFAADEISKTGRRLTLKKVLRLAWRGEG